MSILVNVVKLTYSNNVLIKIFPIRALKLYKQLFHEQNR